MTKPLGQQLYELVHACEFKHGDLDSKEIQAWDQIATQMASQLVADGVKPRDVLPRIQKEIGEWAREQFGDNVSKWTGQILGSLMPLGGMTEEIGELWHATIYRHQGRGFTTDEEYKAAIKDGLGDLMVFMSDYAEREDIDISDTLAEVWQKVRKRRQASWQKDKAKEEADFIKCPMCESVLIDGESVQPDYLCVKCGNRFVDPYPVKIEEEVINMSSLSAETDLNVKAESGEQLLPPAVWCRRLGAEIMDADGWRDKPYSEPICIEEFAVRWCRSTTRHPAKGELKRLVELLKDATYKTVQGGVAYLKAYKHVAEVFDPSHVKPTDKQLETIAKEIPTLEKLRKQTGQGWAEPPVEEVMAHKLYEKGDEGVPDSITDANGDIVLALCKVCGRAEVELERDSGQCPGVREKTVIDKLFPEGPGYYRNNWGPGGQVVKLTEAEVENMNKVASGWQPNRNGGFDTVVVKNGFDVAREIAMSYAEGQNRAHALRTVDQYEKNYHEHYSADNR